MEDEDLQEMFTPGKRQERVRIEAFFFFFEQDPSEPFLGTLQRRPTNEGGGTASHG
jgi:hypothetical protein